MPPRMPGLLRLMNRHHRIIDLKRKMRCRLPVLRPDDRQLHLQHLPRIPRAFLPACSGIHTAGRRDNNFSLCQSCPLHRIRLHIHDDGTKKLRMVILACGKLNGDDLHIRLRHRKRRGIRERMDADFPSLNLVQQPGDVLVIL